MVSCDWYFSILIDPVESCSLGSQVRTCYLGGQPEETASHFNFSLQPAVSTVGPCWSSGCPKKTSSKQSKNFNLKLKWLLSRLFNLLLYPPPWQITSFLQLTLSGEFAGLETYGIQHAKHQIKLRSLGQLGFYGQIVTYTPLFHSALQLKTSSYVLTIKSML